MKRKLTAAVAVLAMAAVAACDTLTTGPFADTQLMALNGSRVWGRVTFHESDGRTSVGNLLDRQAPVAQSMTPEAGMLFVRADVNGLPANRRYSFAVHERGDCIGGIGGVGAPFAPDGAGAPRAGEFPPLSANGEGVAVFAYRTTALTVSPGPRSVVGRAVVIREDVADASLPPGGRGGTVIGCGVIQSRD